MRKVLTSLAVLAALALAGPSHAVPGTASMGWNACNTTPITDLTVTAGQATGITLTVWEKGQDDPVWGYETRVVYGNSTTKTVPDAWRFDPAGCQGPSLVVVDGTTTSKTCPALNNAGAIHAALYIPSLDFVPAGFGYQTSLMLIDLAVAIQDQTVAPPTPIAANAYFLMAAKFDETFGVVGAGNPPNSCGGLETPVCFNLAQVKYIIADGTNNTVLMTVHGGADGDWATANAGGAGGCQGTPAQPATWGQIKSQYRN